MKPLPLGTMLSQDLDGESARRGDKMTAERHDHRRAL
jgi:hypothetical protein